MFHKIPASKKAISKRGLVYGIGINDSWYRTTQRVDGMSFECSAYRKWRCMMRRSYDSKFHEKQKTYLEVTVCKEWLIFSNFAKWFELNDIEGYELDKDIKIKGNKEYGPNTCILTPRDINGLFKANGSYANGLPSGISIPKGKKKYRAQVGVNGKCVTIGYFYTKEEAIEARCVAQDEQIMAKINKYPEFKKYLEQHLHRKL